MLNGRNDYLHHFGKSWSGVGQCPWEMLTGLWEADIGCIIMSSLVLLIASFRKLTLCGPWDDYLRCFAFYT